MTTPTSPSRTRLRPLTLRRYWPAVAIVAIAVITAGVFVGTRDDTLQARVGQVFDSRYSFGEQGRSPVRSLRLPFGEVDVVTTAPRADVPSTVDHADRTAPDDGSFVGVSVKADAAHRLPLPTVGDDDGPAEVTVSLLVGDRSYVVPAPFRGAAGAADRSSWVAVDGSPRDVRVAIRYDGVTQSVDTTTGTRTTGAAAPLYRLATLSALSRDRGCGTPTSVTDGYRIQPEDDIRCNVVVVGALPYLPDTGWAKPGRTWFTVVIGLFDDARFARGSTTYRTVTGGTHAVASVAGTVPVNLASVAAVDYLSSGAAGRRAAFEVPAGTTPRITLTARYEDLMTYETAADVTVSSGPTVEVTWDVTS